MEFTVNGYVATATINSNGVITVVIPVLGSPADPFVAQITTAQIVLMSLQQIVSQILTLAGFPPK